MKLVSRTGIYFGILGVTVSRVLLNRDRGAIFGLKVPNAELPTGRETGWGSEFTGLRQQQ